VLVDPVEVERLSVDEELRAGDLDRADAHAAQVVDIIIGGDLQGVEVRLAGLPQGESVCTWAFNHGDQSQAQKGFDERTMDHAPLSTTRLPLS
jgi:hypothetical protein